MPIVTLEQTGDANVERGAGAVPRAMLLPEKLL